MQFWSSFLLLLSAAYAAADDELPNAPYFAGDAIQPYPPLVDADGKNISVQSLRGTRLFRWYGCSPERSKLIAKAYTDFHTLADQLDVYNNIDWNNQASTDFWGPASGEYKIPDNTRAEIAQILNAAQQVYTISWWPVYPIPGRMLWIEVRCSDGNKGDGAPDPEDKCGDADPDREKCPSGQPPTEDGKATLEAFSDPAPEDSRYSRITFCTDFFKLQELSIAIENTMRRPAEERRDLSRWDNQARVFFHEITHQDYFVNAGPDDSEKSPLVSDLKTYHAENGKTAWYSSYGPYRTRILRNYVDAKPKFSAYYTQRNADSYAWFALAKYVEKKSGRYPDRPRSGRTRPQKEPRDAQTDEEPLSQPQFQLSGSGSSVDTDLIGGDEQPPQFDVQYPGCGDKFGGAQAASTPTSTVTVASTTAAAPSLACSLGSQSPEDGDGLCTCSEDGATTVVTPPSGPWNPPCPTTISGFPS